MKILLIFTGGTIGSAMKNGYIGTDNNQQSMLLSMFQNYAEYVDGTMKDVEFDTISPYTILSENMDLAHLRQLSLCIREHIENYDGIIITHGTDTLQYTAAGLSYLFAGVQFPIMLVSSNYILEDEKANGFANFVAAVSFIQKKRGTGVFTTYQNNYAHTGVNHLAPVYIHRGNRMHAHEVFTDAVFSINDSYYGYYDVRETENGHIYHDYHEKVQHQVQPDTIHTLAENPFYQALENEWNATKILSLECKPDMWLPSLTKEINGILIKAYHSGTLPMDTDGFQSFCEQAKTLQIPMFIAGNTLVSDENIAQYESTNGFTAYQLQILPKTSTVALYMKLLLITALNLDTKILTQCVGEDLL